MRAEIGRCLIMFHSGCSTRKDKWGRQTKTHAWSQTKAMTHHHCRCRPTNKDTCLDSNKANDSRLLSYTTARGKNARAHCHLIWWWNNKSPSMELMCMKALSHVAPYWICVMIGSWWELGNMLCYKIECCGARVTLFHWDLSEADELWLTDELWRTILLIYYPNLQFKDNYGKLTFSLFK